MNKEYYDKIADLMLFSINLKEGDKINIQLDSDCRDAVKSIAYKAYEQGAAYVGLRYIDNFLHAAAINAGKSKIDYPEFQKQALIELCEPGWKTISYLSFAEGDIYADLPSDVSTEYFRNYQKLIEYRRKKTLSGAFPWTLTFIPTADTAVKVFPDLDADSAVEAYWKHVIKIMRLDHDDPVQFWKDKI